MRALPVGARALLIEVATGDEAEALHAELLRRRATGELSVGEIVPAAHTVLLDGLDDPFRLAELLATWDVPPIPTRTQDVVEIPVRYDGPDLPDVAAHWGVDVTEVARIHAGAAYRVAFCGFAPGFGYLTGLPREVPRRATPRTSVPAGSVALAGPYTGVYPRASPGGWQLIGTTDAVLWDHQRVPAALLAPGTLVRFTLLETP
ncbi:allophanate hydrolase subunit 1 [Streptomyces sp. 11x1]|uniref:5-oxoprolinase subunit B family protein n=1 Tax=Streptomyces sp. 11x1 TaxID=3038642 RepID=UPI00160CF355|nr:allophanate hydrolase subunit 1 [Streptomyces sp. 11x1]WNZ13092.1 allophanate hydrolase subunit 1 [Streptomyces sp. 11x1]